MKHLILALTAFFFIGLCVSAYYQDSTPLINDKISAEDTAEPIRAEVVNAEASEFTIDVEFITNASANTEAEFFAVYTSSKKPKNCADFSKTDLSYTKPEENKRQFDLSDHDDIISAIDTKKCVIIPNKKS